MHEHLQHNYNYAISDESPDHFILLQQSLHWSSVLTNIRAFLSLVPINYYIYQVGVFHPLSRLDASPWHGMCTCKWWV